MGVNWGRAGKDARGTRSLPARNSLEVSPNPRTPTAAGIGRWRSHDRDGARAGATLGAPAPSPAFSLPSHVKSRHCECPSMVVRAGMPADRRCLADHRCLPGQSATRSAPPGGVGGSGIGGNVCGWVREWVVRRNAARSGGNAAHASVMVRPSLPTGSGGWGMVKRGRFPVKRRAHSVHSGKVL